MRRWQREHRSRGRGRSRGLLAAIGALLVAGLLLGGAAGRARHHRGAGRRCGADRIALHGRVPGALEQPGERGGCGRRGLVGLLGVYLLVYLSVEVTILVGAVVMMRATRLQEVHGRTLKLFGGAVMAAIALVLLVDASIMERLAGSLVVVGAAVAMATAVALVDRRLRGAGARPAA